MSQTEKKLIVAEREPAENDRYFKCESNICSSSGGIDGGSPSRHPTEYQT